MKIIFGCHPDKYCFNFKNTLLNCSEFPRFFTARKTARICTTNKLDAGVKCTRHPAYDSILPLCCAQAFSVMCADEGLRLRARPGGAAARRGALGAGGCSSRAPLVLP